MPQTLEEFRNMLDEIYKEEEAYEKCLHFVKQDDVENLKQYIDQISEVHLELGVISIAIKSNSEKVLDFLVKKYPELTAVRAAIYDNVDVLKKAFNCGANNHYDVFKFSPGNDKVFEFMLKTYNFTKKEILSMRSKILDENQNIDLLEYLLEKYNDKDILLKYFRSSYLSNNAEIFFYLDDLTKNIRPEGYVEEIYENSFKCGYINFACAIDKKYPHLSDLGDIFEEKYYVYDYFGY